MSNISKEIEISSDKEYLKRLSTARKEIKDTRIYQDKQQDDLFAVESSKKNIFYIVNIRKDGLLSCACPDQKYRQMECKHISKVKIKLFAKTEFNKFDVRSLMNQQTNLETIIINLEAKESI